MPERSGQQISVSNRKAGRARPERRRVFQTPPPRSRQASSVGGAPSHSGGVLRRDKQDGAFFRRGAQHISHRRMPHFRVGRRLRRFPPRQGGAMNAERSGGLFPREALRRQRRARIISPSPGGATTSAHAGAARTILSAFPGRQQGDEFPPFFQRQAQRSGGAFQFRQSRQMFARLPVRQRPQRHAALNRHTGLCPFSFPPQRPQPRRQNLRRSFSPSSALFDALYFGAGIRFQGAAAGRKQANFLHNAQIFCAPVLFTVFWHNLCNANVCSRCRLFGMAGGSLPSPWSERRPLPPASLFPAAGLPRFHPAPRKFKRYLSEMPAYLSI